MIDAYSAGVPVIASDWKYNSEIVNENVGYTYPARNEEAFVDILKFIATNFMELLSKKENCLKEAEKFRIDKAVQIIIEQIGRD